MNIPYYQDEWVTIYHGDCREILPELPKVDLVLTDPPYGVDLDYGSYDDSFANWRKLIDTTLPMMRQLSSGCVLLPTSKLESEAYLFTHYMPDWRICWFKGASCTRSFVGFKDWETIFVYGKPRGSQFHDYFHAKANRVRKEITGHPCPKPVEWALWLISKCSISNDTVVDPFLGSGTTAVACKDLNRHCIGIEINEKYCEIAAKRCSQGVFDLR